MTPLASVMLGLVLGFMGVGLPTLRTIQTMEGRYLLVFFVSVICTLNLFAFTHFIIAKNVWFMAANTIGAGLSVSTIAYKRSKQKKNRRKDDLSVQPQY